MCIRQVTVTTGGEYRKGDIVDIISDKTGAFAKAVVVNTSDLQSKVNFNIVDGGSGYVSSEDNEETLIEYIIGGDGTAPASFKILSGDLTDTFSLSLCLNKFGSNTVFGDSSPRVRYADNSLGVMNTHANTLLCSLTLVLEKVVKH